MAKQGAVAGKGMIARGTVPRTDIDGRLASAFKNLAYFQRIAVLAQPFCIFRPPDVTPIFRGNVNKVN